MTKPLIRIGVISGYPARLTPLNVRGARIELYDVRHALTPQYRERYPARSLGTDADVH